MSLKTKYKQNENDIKTEIENKLSEKFSNLGLNDNSVDNSVNNFVNNSKKVYIITSIDIGVHNLGVSVSSVYENFDLEEIFWIDLYNITDFTHNRIKKNDCKLYHSRTFSDWMDHFFQEYEEFLAKSDFILVERQPPAGFTVVEQLIFSKFRSKCVLINPVNYHMFFHMRDLDYENRKKKSEIIGMNFIEDPELKKQIGYYHRQHDITDSICMLIYWLDKKKQNFIKQQKIDYANSLNFKGLNINDWIQQFRYVS